MELKGDCEKAFKEVEGGGGRSEEHPFDRKLGAVSLEGRGDSVRQARGEGKSSRAVD